MESLTREQIEELAVLYDAFAHALDPFDPARDAAEAQFMEKLTRHHAAIAPRTGFPDFRREAVRVCKLFLRRNQP